MINTSTNLIVLLGATASGKTGLAVAAAQKLNAEIISADSRQVYRGMDIGTGKDLHEYADVPYHLIDIVNPGSEFNLFEFQNRFAAAYNNIIDRGKMPLLCGGTGLYIDTILRNEALVKAPVNDSLRRKLEPLSDQQLQQHLFKLQPQQHNTTDLKERERLLRAIEIATARRNTPPTTIIPHLTPLVFGLRWPRQILRQRITQRLQQRLQQGMIEEVEELHKHGVSWESLEFYGLEYRFIAQYLQGKLSRNDAVQKLNSAIHQFAKRQDTWFRRMEKHGCNINWLDGDGQPLQQMLTIMQPASCL